LTFETGSAHEAYRRRIALLRQVRERGEEIAGVRSLRQIPPYNPHGMRIAARILIAEKIGDERPVAGFTRELRKRASR
jgi:hypothetical protein